MRWRAANCGWPLPRLEQYRCTAATAAAMALPRSLGDLGAALGLSVQKDKEGMRLIGKFSIPRKPTKDDKCSACDGTGSINVGCYDEAGNVDEYAACPKCGGTGAAVGPLWNEPEDHPEDFDLFKLYCDRDVETECAADDKLVPLSTDEQELWRI